MIRDIEQFTKVLKELLEYYGKPANETAISVWFSVCNQNLTDEEFLQTVTLCMRQRDRVPAIDEFVGLLKGDPVALEDIALQDAWKSILEAAAISNSQDKDHTAFRAAVLNQMLTDSQRYALQQLGGFSRLGELGADDLTWKCKDFYRLCKSYNQKLKHPLTEDKQLPGSVSPGVSIKRKGFSSLGESLF
jgi:hypothetical protein